MLKKKDLRIAMQASVNAYGGEYGKVKKVFDEVKQFKKKNVNGHFGYLKDTLYIVFEGSDGKLDWKDNFKFHGKSVYNKDIKIHAGFLRQYNLVKDIIYKEIDRLLNSAMIPDKIVVTGHSLGAAEATICSLDLACRYSNEKIVCVTFGSPRVGNYYFAKYFNKKIKHSYRFVYGQDLVASVPLVIMGYWHVNKMIRLGLPWYDILLFPITAVFGNPVDHYPQKYLRAMYKKYK